jgi:carbon starvation protein
VLWVVFGTIFFAGIHDSGALWASNRHKAKSMGALSETVIGKRTRSLFMIVTFLVLLMVNSVFGVVIANAFVGSPGAVFPAWSAIVVALIIGQLVHRKFNLIVLCIGGVTVLYLSVYAGSVMPLELPPLFGLTPQANWIIILFVYAAIASMLPVWMFLHRLSTRIWPRARPRSFPCCSSQSPVGRCPDFTESLRRGPPRNS